MQTMRQLFVGLETVLNWSWNRNITNQIDIQLIITMLKSILN